MTERNGPMTPKAFHALLSDRGSGQDAIPDTSAHAAAWLRLRPGQRRPRHTGAGVYEGAPDVPGTWLCEVPGTELSRIGEESETHRASLIDMANIWRKLAEEAENKAF
jgi:hypothetical protein